jgi:hypothetical protein
MHSACPERCACKARVSRDGAAPWFETPRMELPNPGRDPRLRGSSP